MNAIDRLHCKMSTYIIVCICDRINKVVAKGVRIAYQSSYFFLQCREEDATEYNTKKCTILTVTIVT